MAKVRCITMQKNESKLLEAWIKYYGYLFGFDNLYILDNGSNESDIFEILNKYQKIGVNVDFSFNEKKDFDRKGEIISEIVHKWDDKNEDYDFVIPIDCDEFIILCDNGASISRSKIDNYLDNLIGKKEAFVMQKLFLNIPEDTSFFTPAIVPKSMFAKNTLGFLDHGFHHPRSSQSDETFITKLGYIHLHNKNFSDVLQAAKEKLEFYINTEDKDNLINYTGPGLHLVKYFFMDENIYKKSFLDNANVYIPDFHYLLDLLDVNLYNLFGTYSRYNINLKGKNGEFLVRYANKDKTEYNIGFFSENNYISNHEDLHGVSLDPLSHFSEYGHHENRKIDYLFSCKIEEFYKMYRVDFINENKLYSFKEKAMLKEDPLYFSKIHMRD
ncbi:hypothetical protein GOX01_24170 [Gluconobacter oxydans]|uniref:Glycosyl transferase family 2 n=1 Tax=Gluconobacter oxydans TaxID=442 RepID=A0AB35AQN0_GLUOY|nr:glycosyltransferase family 2 protein [Gluconobacter oxydans]MBF0857226.1 hypothetical protein [Gluconobacter oxydans]TCW22805.1 glycosyl transferase family 2 [Gluconobacter oxydans]GEC62086.1 hypothetical protein GOX01_24170 [Gluconobacter oxydans]